MNTNELSTALNKAVIFIFYIDKLFHHKNLLQIVEEQGYSLVIPTLWITFKNNVNLNPQLVEKFKTII